MSDFKIKAQTFNAKLGEYLKNVRQEQRYTMRALADKLATPHSFIGKTEQQNRRLDVGEFVHYCHAIDVDPVKAIKEVEKMVKAAELEQVSESELE